jgi:hypothetical protein
VSPEGVEYASEGERIARRKLLKEARAGVTHYVPGQHHAFFHRGGSDYSTGEPLDVAHLTYVDVMGHLCCVLLARRDETDEWRVTWAGRSGQTYTTPARRIDQAEEFPLSDAMREALANAKEEPWPTV